MERRQLVAKLLIKHSITDFSKCRRAADAPSVTGFAKVSGCPILRAALEHPFVFIRCGGVELIAVQVKIFELIGVLNRVLCGIAHHQSAGAFGVEADDFVFAVFFVLKDGGDDLGVEFLGLDGFEIFLRGEVNHDVFFGALQGFVKPLGDDVAPEFVEIFTAWVGKGGAHF